MHMKASTKVSILFKTFHAHCIAYSANKNTENNPRGYRGCSKKLIQEACATIEPLLHPPILHSRSLEKRPIEAAVLATIFWMKLGQHRKYITF